MVARFRFVQDFQFLTLFSFRFFWRQPIWDGWRYLFYSSNFSGQLLQAAWSVSLHPWVPYHQNLFPYNFIFPFALCLLFTRVPLNCFEDDLSFLSTLCRHSKQCNPSPIFPFLLYYHFLFALLVFTLPLLRIK